MDSTSELPSFISIFKPVPDERQTAKIKHCLTEIIFIAIVATVAGADDWEEIEYFAIEKEEWLRKYLTLSNGIPSHDTIERCFSWINPKIFLQCFMEWTAMVSQVIKGGIVAIDGKTMRGTADESNGKKALHVVSAWFSETGMVLGQVKTHEKSNEITAIPELLDLLDVTGCIVTIDALGTQKDIVRKIKKDKKADYVLALKANHPLLYDEVIRYFDDRLHDVSLTADPLESYQEIEKGHGRIEKRQYYLTPNIDWIAEKKEWEGLSAIGMVTYTSEKAEKKEQMRRYYLCSLKSIKPFAKAVRQHWGIESMHWSLDVTFNEDAKRVKKDRAPENLAILHRLALNIMKMDKSKKTSLKKKRRIAGWNESFLERIFENAMLKNES